MNFEAIFLKNPKLQPGGPFTWIFLLVVLMVFSTGCKKDQQAISDIPVITFDTLSPNQVVEYQDSILIVISYVDGLADLGADSSSVKNLFLTDSRNGAVTSFSVPKVAPSGTNTAISGKINIVLPPQALVNTGDTIEAATYSIYLLDQVGRQSNTVTTTPLVIKW